MTDKKYDQNEILIEELYEKLWWYTYEASEEEFNANEVDAIVRLLEVMEPIQEDHVYEPGADASFERFKKRYGLEAEFAEGTEGDIDETEVPEDGFSRETTGTDVPEILIGVGTADGRDAMERKKGAEGEDPRIGKKDMGRGRAGGDGAEGEDAGMDGTEEDGIEKSDAGENGAGTDVARKAGRRKRLFRIGGAAAACAVLMFSLNVGTYALRERSFLEIVMERIGRSEVIVTGNEAVERRDDSIKCETWGEAEEILGEEVLQPGYIPDGYELKEMTVTLMETRNSVYAKYCNEDKYFIAKIYIFPADYSKNAILYDEEWEFIKKDADGMEAQYYAKDGAIEASFAAGKGIYYILGNENLETIERIVNGMK